MKNGFTPLEISCKSVRNYKFLTGFTVIEVLIVVLIIGIMATLSIPTFQGAMIKAKFPEMFAAVSRLEQEVDYFVLERGWFAVRFDSATRSELQALAAELEGEFFQYVILDKDDCEGVVIRVVVKDYPVPPNPYLCYRGIGMFAEWQDVWYIYDAHPWAKYLKIEGAFHAQ